MSAGPGSVYVLAADGGATRCWDTSEHWLGFGVWALLALVSFVVMDVRLLRVGGKLARIEAGGNLLTGPFVGWGRDILPSKVAVETSTPTQPFAPSPLGSGNALAQVVVKVVMSVSFVLTSRMWSGLFYSLVGAFASAGLVWNQYANPSFCPTTFPLGQLTDRKLLAARLRSHAPNKAALAASVGLLAASVVQLVAAAVAFSQGTVAQCEAALAHPALLAVQLAPPAALVASLPALVLQGLRGRRQPCCRRGHSSKVAPKSGSGVSSVSVQEEAPGGLRRLCTRP